MSLYNAINGVNPATFFLLPMLGEKHPDDYPRFRDCFAGELTNDNEDDQFGIPKKRNDLSAKVISVYTRVGGGNREDYQNEIDELRSHPNYIKDYDDDFDSTFATFQFSIPKEFESDYDLIIENNLQGISENYKTRLYKVYPKLKETFDKIFIAK
jgi:hypothetical protein